MKSLARMALVVFAVTGAVEVSGAEVSYSKQAVVIDEQLVIAGLLDLQALRASQSGDVLVIDLRTEEEGTPAEARAASELGLRYENIQVSSVTVDPAQVARLDGLLAGARPDTTVVIHCVSGNRAGMLYGATRVQSGASLGSVKASLEGVLNKQPAIDGLEAYAASLDGGR